MKVLPHSGLSFLACIQQGNLISIITSCFVSVICENFSQQLSENAIFPQYTVYYSIKIHNVSATNSSSSVVIWTQTLLTQVLHKQSVYCGKYVFIRLVSVVGFKSCAYLY